MNRVGIASTSQRLLVGITALGLYGGCGYPDSLDGFSKVSECSFDKVTVEGEIALDCDKVERNLELARDYYRWMGFDYERSFPSMKISIWDRDVLYCDQYFIVCVHWVRGDSVGYQDHPGFQPINLSRSGDLLLHEMLHYAIDDEYHTKWGRNGFNAMDHLYRDTYERL